MCVLHTEEAEVQEGVECGSDPEMCEEVDEEEESEEGEGEEGESPGQSRSCHPETLATVHGGEEKIRGHVCPPQSKTTPVSERNL